MFWRRHINRQSTPASAHRESPSYIVFRLDALGDVVLTTPLFRALKNAHPKSRLTVVVQRSYKTLLATNPYIDEILTPPEIQPRWLPKQLRRLTAAVYFYWRDLRGRRFDFAVSPRWDVDEHLATFLCALTNAEHRVGFTCATTDAKRKINRGFDLTYDICLPPGPICHEVDRNLAMAEWLGAAVSRWRHRDPSNRPGPPRSREASCRCASGNDVDCSRHRRAEPGPTMAAPAFRRYCQPDRKGQAGPSRNRLLRQRDRRSLAT